MTRSIWYTHTPSQAIVHQPSSLYLRYWNVPTCSPFVNWSAICSDVFIGLIEMKPLETRSRKWWYFITMCFVRGLYLGFVANSSAPLLSSNNVQFYFTVYFSSPNIDAISSIWSINGIKSLIAVLNTTYSASTVDRLISACNFDTHSTGQPK